jgi:hypothetical protein
MFKDIVTFTGPSNLGTILNLKIKRLATDPLNTYNKKIYVPSFSLHYECDKVAGDLS